MLRSSEALRKRLVRELQSRFEALEGADLGAVDAAVAGFERDVENLPADVRKLHRDWEIDAKERLLEAWGLERTAPPRGERLTVYVVRDELRELQHGLARRAHPAECDCALLVARGWDHRPSSPRLVATASAFDGYYEGTEHLCECCGARWREWIADDDFGTHHWEPTAGR